MNKKTILIIGVILAVTLIIFGMGIGEAKKKNTEPSQECIRQVLIKMNAEYYNTTQACIWDWSEPVDIWLCISQNGWQGSFGGSLT